MITTRLEPFDPDELFRIRWVVTCVAYDGIHVDEQWFTMLIGALVAI